MGFCHLGLATGDGTFLAFQELHDDRVVGRDLAISRGLGLPPWVNHLAFRADDEADLDAARDRLLASGCDVVAMRHSHSRSIYTEDPNGNVVEWSWVTEPFTDADRDASLERMHDPHLSRDAPTEMEFFLAADSVAT